MTVYGMTENFSIYADKPTFTGTKRKLRRAVIILIETAKRKSRKRRQKRFTRPK